MIANRIKNKERHFHDRKSPEISRNARAKKKEYKKRNNFELRI